MYSSESLFMIFIDKNNNKYQLGFLKSTLFIKFFPIQNKNTTKAINTTYIDYLIHPKSCQKLDNRSKLFERKLQENLGTTKKS